MKIVWEILDQPFFLCLYIYHKILATAGLLHAGLTGQRPFELAALGGLVGWLALAAIVAAVVIATARFILDNATVNSVLWRLLVVLILYAFLSILFYTMANFAKLIMSEMEYKP